MKILCISDQEDLGLWDFFRKDKLNGIDLIISCGDLEPAYLEFLATMSNRLVLYVRGNHDTKYDDHPPLGCICIDDRLYNYNGLRIVGLGGSMRYGNKKDMYSEEEMLKRCRKLKGTLSFTNGFDLLVTHSPSYGIGDREDLPHRGFQSFLKLIDTYHPKYHIFGHVHQSYGDFKRKYQYHGTEAINCYDKYILEIPEDEYPEEGQTGSVFYDWYIKKMK